MISQLVAVVPSMAADALLPIAQYVTKTGSVKCGADGTTATSWLITIARVITSDSDFT